MAPFFTILFLWFATGDAFRPSSIPPAHFGCWFRSLSERVRDDILDACQQDPDSLALMMDLPNSTAFNRPKEIFCQKILSSTEKLPCWGYEDDLPPDRKCLLYKPKCDGFSESWARDSNEQMESFFLTADFGYVRQQKLELQHYCSPRTSDHNASQLKCSKFIRYCQANNIYIDFSNVLQLPEPIRYREDLLRYGDIGGWNCDLNRKDLLKENGHKSPLMSWFAEISNFKVESNPRKCDITIEKPTMVMKLDASVNMYHHFCDFLNLYLTLHLNQTFHRDIQFVIWDTHPYRSNFGPVWSAFTRNPLLNLADFGNKTVCFDDVIFPLLPRMMFGFYYNMPLLPGCRNSGVFRAFNRHLLYHLGLSDSEQLCSDEIIRITFLDRSTKYRRVLNKEVLLKSLRQTLSVMENPDRVEIKVVDFNHRMPFAEQVRISSNTDILIGMHGAGLTHTLFQPDYGLLFELYNCDDKDCYRDLARLRGVDYLTWYNRQKLTIVSDQTQRPDEQATGAPHAKFVNYNFDPDEFVRLTLEAIETVRQRKADFHRRIADSRNQSEIYFNKTEL